MNFTTENVTAGQLNSLVRIIMRQMRITDPAEVIRRINVGEWVVTTARKSQLSIWKRVSIGALNNAEFASQQLEKSGIKITRPGKSVLDRMVFMETETVLDLVIVSFEDLKLAGEASTEEIYYQATLLHGASLCPAEVALQLWIQYPHILGPEDGLLVAMEAVHDERLPRDYVFNLWHDEVEGRMLDAQSGGPFTSHNSYDKWVFVRK